MKPETPLLTVDGIVLDGKRIVLIRRLHPPFEGQWALPGGFVEIGETVEEACVREIREETGLDVDIVRLLGVYSDPGRDPRGHTVSVVFLCYPSGGELRGADDAAEARWFTLPVTDPLAFDHEKILEDLNRILKG
ncbi:MAG TPA: NUDIX hydrolase [Thermoanaerobaculia bacterium]|nr:NUDIX hydrolase [Thermoanaerobaculia bacterium]HUM29578.1 NUDIX hydrolase [Thermoanaerobaculia bacterium]HXK67961.1 NUDIX hydrolase [Thermoanaerobaculia bacterium]